MNEPVILHIETSTEVCSVALSRGTDCISYKESTEGLNHASLLTLFIEELMLSQNISASKLDAIAVSSGPGSYTGLRIGVSVAKGLCYSADVPLISVSTLQAMAFGYAKQHDVPPYALLCPMIDARRMEVYTALYDKDGNKLKDVSAEIIEENSFAEWFNKHEIHFFGTGAAKCQTLITNTNAIFSENFKNSATCMIKPALLAYNEKQFENIAYFEPFYLKGMFVANNLG